MPKMKEWKGTAVLEKLIVAHLVKGCLACFGTLQSITVLRARHWILS